MRAWKDPAAPPDKGLPPGFFEPPSRTFQEVELEVVKAFGYTWSGWTSEPVAVRARLIAHELIHARRSAYEAALERARSKAGAKSAKPPNAWERQRQQWGLR